jgi:CIC family chloride channel protein
MARISEDYKTSAWMLVAIPLGVAAGLVGHFFTSSILRLRNWFKTRQILPSWVNPAAGGLSCGILGLTAFYLTSHLGNAQNSVFSIGYGSLELAFENKLSFGIIAVLLVAKFLAVVINYASGGSGGLFSPTLFLGGMLGCLTGLGLSEFQHIGEWIPAFPTDSKVIGGCVLLGMGAMFAAVVRCPFTSLIIIFEMTGNYSLILPLMAGNVIAWQISRQLRPFSIYSSLLLQDGISLRKLPAYRGAQDYRKLPVQTIMSHDVFVIEKAEKPADALKRIELEQKRFHAYPVVDVDGKISGVITLHEMQENVLAESVGEILSEQNLLFVHPDTSIRDAANRMIVKDFQQVPVVSQADERKLLGWLTLNDIARQQNAVEG